MSDISRRDVLRRLALALTAAGTLDRASAQKVHHLAAQGQSSNGPYTPRIFTDHEFRTLERLTDFIIPVENGAPGALAAGCAAWIDTISSENEELTTIYKDGFKWLDEAMKARGAVDFVSATPSEQTALLDRIAYRRNQTPELAAGIQFFSWVRRMTVDAFYTSEIGIRDIDYRGNSPMASFPSPVEAIAYAVKRIEI
ncbi:MAG: gluconate 2-dehydrogenase subunit 3 family protein [Vicinamibacterales bacterium]